jgi:hypothetical protein
MSFLCLGVWSYPFLWESRYILNKPSSILANLKVPCLQSYRYAILDHLAHSMLYLSTAPSFWFSLNLAYDGLDVSLSDRLGRL